MRIAIFRTAHFNAAHRLHIKEWSDEKNREVFGICNNPHFHGHNYDLEVKLIGETDPLTGFFINLSDLATIIDREVIDYLDHRNLNVEIPEFAQTNPTVENICHVIWTRLRQALPQEIDLTVRLYETPRNYAEFPA